MSEDQALESSCKNTQDESCSQDKYWVRPHQRKKTSKKGKHYIENVKGYCCSYHAPYHKMAEEEKMSYDHLFYALTIYGEARDQNDASIRAIAWIIRNRLKKRANGSYCEIVLKPAQFKCWDKSDPNYEILQHPDKHDAVDKKAWEKCKKIAEEIHNAPEKDNPPPGVYNYFSGNPDLKHNPWEEIHFDLPHVHKFHFVRLEK